MSADFVRRFVPVSFSDKEFEYFDGAEQIFKFGISDEGYSYCD